MADQMIRQFDVDYGRLAVISECMQHYDVGDPGAEWPHNLISRQAVVYGSGVIARKNDPVVHVVDPDELSLCRQLAAEAERLMDGVPVGMGSEARHPFRGFFIAANVDDTTPATIDDRFVWLRFGGTLFPSLTIRVEPLSESTTWWAKVANGLRDFDQEQRDATLERWRAMVRWFRQRPEFIHIAFVQIGDPRELKRLPRERYPRGTVLPGRVFPKLAIGLTRNASFAGLFGCCVHN